MPNEKPDTLVTIATFGTVPDADLAHSILTANGIQATLADVNTRIIAPHLALSVKLQVMRSQARRALEILNQNVERHPELKGNVARLPQCPECGSYELSSKKLGRLMLFVCLLLMMVPYRFLKHSWKCDACGHHWKA